MHELVSLLTSEAEQTIQFVLVYTIIFGIFKKINSPNTSWGKVVKQLLPVAFYLLLGFMAMKLIGFYFGQKAANSILTVIVAYLLWKNRNRIISTLREKKLFFLTSALFLMFPIFFFFWYQRIST